MVKSKLSKTAEKKPVEEKKPVKPPVETPAVVETSKLEAPTPPFPTEAAPSGGEGALTENETTPTESVSPTERGPPAGKEAAHPAARTPAEPAPAAEPEPEPQPVGSRHYSV